MGLPEETEHRIERRNRVLKGASILGTVNKSEVSCMIRNMHAHGAELKVPVEAAVPQEFLLYVPTDGVAYRCQLRWRKNDRCGVTFIGTEAKPHWHYG